MIDFGKIESIEELLKNITDTVNDHAELFDHIIEENHTMKEEIRILKRKIKDLDSQLIRLRYR